MNEQELSYIGSFDPHEKEDVFPVLIHINDGITGVPIAEGKTYSLREMEQFVVDSIAKHYIHDGVLTINILSLKYQQSRYLGSGE